MENPFMWGANGQQVPADRQRVIDALASVQPIGDPMQGFAQMAHAAVDNYNSNPLNQFPDAPGGNSLSGGLFGLAGRMFGGGGGLY